MMMSTAFFSKSSRNPHRPDTGQNIAINLYTPTAASPTPTGQNPFGASSGFFFRGEAFNLFNTVVYSAPTSDISIPATFGHVTSIANNPRSLQLGAKIIF
jgi:hypothetical protein